MTNPTTRPTALLSFIRGAETSRGYKDYYRGSIIAPPKPLTEMTVREVREWQRRSVRAGSKSSAAGGYQIISKTMDTLIAGMGLTGDEIFDEALQDRMAETLLVRRGFNKWQAGQMSDEDFAANLSREWAALPTASGRSAYHGDGLNAATVSTHDLFGALSTTRNGDQIDLSGIDPNGTGGGLSGPFPGAAGGDAERARRMSLVSPAGETSGGIDLTQVGATPSAAFRSREDDRQGQMQADRETPGFFDGARIAMKEQWVVPAIMRQIGKDSFIPDPDFQYDEDLWKQVTEGLPEDYHKVFGGAVSAAHAREIAAYTRESYQRDLKLSRMGWTGVGLQLGAAILDPAAIAVSAATEGMLAPVIYSAKLTKIQRALRAGAVAAGTNVSIDGYMTSQDPVGDYRNLAYTAAAGFLIGGAIGAYRPSYLDGAVRGHMKAIEKADGDIFDKVPAGAPAVAPSGAPDGSLSAARVDGLKVDKTDAQMALEAAGATPKSAFGRARIDLVGRLKQSDNAILRQVAGLLDEDAVGNRGQVTVYSANEKAHRVIRQVETRFYRDHQEAFNGWLKDRGRRARGFWDPALRAEFNAEVGKAVRRPLDADGNAHVQKVAARVKTEYAALLQFGKEHNVRGFQDLKANDLYLSRRHNIQALDDVMEPRGGEVHRLFAEAFMSGVRKTRNADPAAGMRHADLDYEDALDMAKAYLKSIRSRKFQGFDVQTAFRGNHGEALQEMLLDEGLDPSRVAQLLDKFTPRNDPKTGKLGYAKHRMVLDETFEDPRSGLKIEDFLENDIEDIFGAYTNSVVRTGAIEEAFGSLKVANRDGTMPDHAPSIETVKRWIKETSQGNVKGELDGDLELLDRLYRGVRGIPQEMDSRFNRTLRRMRQFNFMRVMGQVGVSNMAELGLTLSNGGFKAMVQHMPTFRDVVLKARKGKLSNPFLDEIEAIWSPGNDILRNQAYARIDDAFTPSSAIRGGKATGTQVMDQVLQQGANSVAVLSGMVHTNRVIQRLNARVLVQRFLDHAHGDRAINQARLNALGIGEAMGDRIGAQIRKHMGHREGFLGKKATHINIDKWDDIDAKNAFINGVDRWSRRVMQENSVGTMPAFMTREMFKSVFQFRSFMLGAWTKQVLSGAETRDWEVFSGWAASMFFGGLFYVGQTYVNSIARPDQEEWLEDKLGWDDIGKAGFQRAGFSTFFPFIADTLGEGFAGGPIFDYRTTDLSSGVWGNPTWDLMNKAHKAASGSLKAMVSDDYDFSQQDARALTGILPLQNAFVIRNVLAHFTDGLPPFSE